MRPCFLKMPARWPISETDVSQLPRWPTASFTVSSAAAKLAEPSSASAPSAPAMAFALIEFPPGYYCRFVVVVSRHAFARRLAPAAETTPVRGLGYYTFVGTDRRVRDARARGSNRRTAFGHCARRLDHETAERHHGDVGSADTLLAAVADRPHAFPHRDILIGNARNAGEVAGLH